MAKTHTNHALQPRRRYLIPRQECQNQAVVQINRQIEK